MLQLSIADIRAARQSSLLLAGHDFTTPEQIVRWLGAMQAQELGSVKWSLGVRLPTLVESDIDAALERGEILRTWPMRGTIHLIDARDARWMLATTGVRALSGVQKRWEYLDLNRATVDLADETLAHALAGGKRLTRAQCGEVLQAAGIDVSAQRLYHLLWHASQVGVTCIGPNLGKEQTFVLLDDFVPAPRQLSGDEALAELAWYFVRGHGPVPTKDFAGWAGIAMGAARKALAANDGRITEVDSEVGELWARTDLDAQVHQFAADSSSSSLLALPGFDEFILGYKDRALMLEPGQMNLVVPGGNGIFRPTVVDGGRVVGTWKRSVTKKKVRVEVSPFGEFTRDQEHRFCEAAKGYGRYLGLEVEVRWPQM